KPESLEEKGKLSTGSTHGLWVLSDGRRGWLIDATTRSTLKQRMKFSVIIPTYNRANDLRPTLSSLAEISSRDPWELIVVDNNSTDETGDVVRQAQSWFPVPLRYIFEGNQGRCAALNAGIIESTGEILVTTDDDVRVDEDWLDRAAEGLLLCHCDYIGGKVLPMWGRTRPGWLPNRGGRHWSVIALLE